LYYPTQLLRDQHQYQSISSTTSNLPETGDFPAHIDSYSRNFNFSWHHPEKQINDSEEVKAKILELIA
jgi:hypothetical protein